MQIADRGEDLGHLAMELSVGHRRDVGRMLERLQQQLEALRRIDRVHRPLQRQVRVVLIDEEQRLADDQHALLVRQRVGRGHEGGEIRRAGKMIPDGGAQLLQVGRRLRGGLGSSRDLGPGGATLGLSGNNGSSAFLGHVHFAPGSMCVRQTAASRTTNGWPYPYRTIPSPRMQGEGWGEGAGVNQGRTFWLTWNTFDGIVSALHLHQALVVRPVGRGNARALVGGHEVDVGAGRGERRGCLVELTRPLRCSAASPSGRSQRAVDVDDELRVAMRVRRRVGGHAVGGAGNQRDEDLALIRGQLSRRSRPAPRWRRR